MNYHSPSIFRRLLSLLSIFLLLFFACKKNVYQDNHPNTISDIKEAFQNTNWKERLSDPFNDSLSLVWSPDWDAVTQKKSADGTIFYYVPLKSTLRNKRNTGQHDLINKITFQQYLVATIRSGICEFQKVTYIPQYRLTNRSTGQDLTFNYSGFTGYSVAEDAHGYSKVSYFRTGGLLFEDGRRINSPAANSKSIYAPQAKVAPGFDTVNLWELNPDPGMLPDDPLAGECFTKCFWATTCGDGVWNITRTIAAPKEPCTQPMESACDNDRIAVWRLNYSEKFNCTIPGKDPNAVPFPPGDGGGGGEGGLPAVLPTPTTTVNIKDITAIPCPKSYNFIKKDTWQTAVITGYYFEFKDDVITNGKVFRVDIGAIETGMPAIKYDGTLIHASDAQRMAAQAARDAEKMVCNVIVTMLIANPKLDPELVRKDPRLIKMFKDSYQEEINQFLRSDYDYKESDHPATVSTSQAQFVLKDITQYQELLFYGRDCF